MYFAYNSANMQCITTLTTGVMFSKHLPHSCVSLNVIRKMQTNLDGIFKYFLMFLYGYSRMLDK